jgi:hypothetical protein
VELRTVHTSQGSQVENTQQHNRNLAVTANQHVDYCALWIIRL